MDTGHGDHELPHPGNLSGEAVNDPVLQLERFGGGQPHRVGPERLRPGQALKVFQEYMEITARTFTETRLEIDHPEVIVRPEVWRVGLLDDPSVAEMTELGTRAMKKALPRLRAQFSFSGRVSRMLRQVQVAARR